MIGSLKSELNETRNAKDELVGKLEGSKQDARTWKDKVRDQKAEAARLKRRTRRFSGSFRAVCRVH